MTISNGLRRMCFRIWLPFVWFAWLLPASPRSAAAQTAQAQSAQAQSAQAQSTDSTSASDSRSAVALGSLNSIAVSAELKTVKLYGAGGVGGLDTYQSGFFIDAQGHVLTVWSTVLDVDTIIAVTSDGRRLECKVVGIDPNLEIAVLESKQAATEPSLSLMPW